MTQRFAIGTSLAALAISACGALNGEFRFSEDEGIPPIKSKYEIDIPADFKCGSTIEKDGYKVETVLAGDACEFSFKQDIEVIKEADYSGPNGATLAGVKLVKRLEIEVTTFSVKDGTSGAALDLNTAIRALSVKVHGKEIISKDDVLKLPGTKVVDGEPLNKVKSDIIAKKPVILPIDAKVVLPLEPKPPAKLAVDFEGQPALVMGGGF